MGCLDLGIVITCTISSSTDRTGTVVWSCLPRFDGDPLFCSLLDDGAERGSYGRELDRLPRPSSTLCPTPRLWSRV